MRHTDHENEMDVLERCLNGCSTSFEVIVDRYQSLVCGITFASTGNFGRSEELAQETFVLAWKNLRQLRDLSRFKPWLCQIARNVIQNWRRDAHRDIIQQAVSLGYASEPTTLKAEPSGLAMQEEERAVVNRAIEAMPEKYRLPLILFYREDKSSCDVARLLGLSENATRQRIARARAMLKDRVAEMVETNLVRTKPGKVFTGAVLASIAGVTMKGTAITATATGGWTLYAGFSGLTVKIMTVAAVLAILAGVTHLIREQTSSGPPAEASVQPSMAVVEPNSASAVDQSIQQEIPEDDPNPQSFSIPQTENTALPLAIADPCTNDTSSDDTPAESICLQCVDEAGDPVSGALVYLLQMSRQGPDLVLGFNQNSNYQADGPLTSDANGFVECETFKDPDGRDVYCTGYGVLPHQRVGAWYQFMSANSPSGNQDFTLLLHKSKTVSGQVLIPPGYAMESVHVDTMSVGVPSRDDPFGDSFSCYQFEDVGAFPGLFDVSVDAIGRFEVSDLPAEGRFTLRARAPGLGEEQVSVYDAQRVDVIELSLLAHGVIEGTVQFADTHTPAANIRVLCRTSKGITRSHVGITDNLGFYRIEGLSEGTYKVFVGMDAFPPSLIARARNDVQVSPGFVADSVDFELETGVVISGTMTNRETGIPIQGVRVGALNPGESGGVCINSALSDEEGCYSLRLPIGDSMLYVGGVPKGTLYPGKQGSRVVSVVSATEPHEPVDFLFGSDLTHDDEIGKGTVSGYVFDQDGTPISGVSVTDGRNYEYGEAIQQLSGIRLGKTNEDGRFSVQIETEGEHEISIGGFEWSVHRSEWFRIGKDEIKDLGDIYLVPYVLTMSAQILDEEGIPIPHTTYLVEAQAYYNLTGTRSTDSEGMIFLENLPETEITLCLSRDGYQQQDWKGFAGDHVEIILEKKE